MDLRTADGVSFVVPVRNGARWLVDVLSAIAAQRDGRPTEIIVVDDRSVDGTAAVLQDLVVPLGLRVLQGAGRGAAAAINQGVRAARYPVICQVDQDVILQPGWMSRLADALADPAVAAAQGYYESHPRATLSARAMNRDLEQRYAAIAGSDTDHVCTGNVAYRASALEAIGLFDESLGYGYDNDVSYRLRAAGHRLTICRDARSVHLWREGLPGYLVQQYGFGYGRLDLLAKHPRRLHGDRVSPWGMMIHAPLLACALVALCAAAVSPAALTRPLALTSVGLIGLLAAERLIAGMLAARRFHDPAPLIFPALHLSRDLAWVAAIAVWAARRLTGRVSRPSHSMRARSTGDVLAAGLPGPGLVVAVPAGLGGGTTTTSTPSSGQSSRTLCLIPAHNESANLHSVITELRAYRPDFDILVVDDGSTDGTEDLVRDLGVLWLRFPERLGIGSAVRAALRYADRLGYGLAVRMDGDGQHRAQDLAQLIAPLEAGCADVVLGSRFTDEAASAEQRGRVLRRLLSICLSRLTGHCVTDPTSGFYALGPRAIRVVAEHHPSGYAEPELRLFLPRNGLRAIEVPVSARARLSGRTSLTAGRLTGAAARALLAMIVVPFRPTVGDVRD
jgi:glycosyltransferase involved in cell wall biosynthesis